MNFLDLKDRRSMACVSKKWEEVELSYCVDLINQNPEKSFLDHGISLDKIKKIAGSRGKNIRCLKMNLGCNSYLFNTAFLIEKCPNLDTLDLSECDLTRELLDKIIKLEKLKVLDIPMSAITKGGVQKIASISGLESLDVKGCNITDEMLGEIIKLKNLRVLNLSRNAITDKGVKKLRVLTNLESLNLGECDITEKALDEIVNLEKIKTLCISSCEITEEGAKKLALL